MKIKRPFIFLGAILVFALIAAVLTLTGEDDPKIEGTYALVDASGTGSEMFKATVDDASLEISDDDTGTFKMLSQETPVKVNTEESKISFDGGTSYSAYTLDGKKLTIENGGYKAIFKRK